MVNPIPDLSLISISERTSHNKRGSNCNSLLCFSFFLLDPNDLNEPKRKIRCISYRASPNSRGSPPRGTGTALLFFPSAGEEGTASVGIYWKRKHRGVFVFLLSVGNTHRTVKGLFLFQARSSGHPFASVLKIQQQQQCFWFLVLLLFIQQYAAYCLRRIASAQVVPTPTTIPAGT